MDFFETVMIVMKIFHLQDDFRSVYISMEMKVVVKLTLLGYKL